MNQRPRTAKQWANLRARLQPTPGLFATRGYSCGVTTFGETGHATQPHHDPDYDSTWLDTATTEWERR